MAYDNNRGFGRNGRSSRSSFGGGRGRGRGGFGGNRGGSRGGFGGRSRDGFVSAPRDRFEKTEVTCDKCGKLTDVPFKPTTGKPIYCRDCFGSAGRGNFNQAPSQSFSGPNSGSSGISKEQFNELNEKVDRILEILENIEFEEDEESEDEEAEEKKN